MCNEKECKFRAAYEDVRERLCGVNDAILQLLDSEDSAERAVAEQLLETLGMGPDGELHNDEY